MAASGGSDSEASVRNREKPVAETESKSHNLCNVCGGTESSRPVAERRPSRHVAGAEPAVQGFDLSFLSLSGVDDSVSPRTLCDISQEFSFVEWGVNFRAEKQGKEPRYASLAWLRQLQEEIDRRQHVGKHAAIHFAAHLCGEYCVDVLKGDTSLVRTLWEDYGFARVRLSPTQAHGVNSSNLKKYLPSLRSVILALPQVEFVLSVTKETRPLSFALMDDPQPNLAFFFDSEANPRPPNGQNGAEVSANRPPPVPHPGIHCGYGGNLTVENLPTELQRIAAAVNDPRRPIWVDLEVGLHTVGPGKRDDFDLKKARECIQTVFDLGLT